MPASSLFSEIDRPGGIGDERALQLALELSMLGFGGEPPLNSIAADLVSPDVFDSVVSALPAGGLDEVRSKKSQNMTECVPVPSSEHVAEIVGRQGRFLIFSWTIVSRTRSVFSLHTYLFFGLVLMFWHWDGLVYLL